MWMLSPARKGSAGRRPHALVVQADQMHLDPPVARVVDGPVLEGAQVEVGAELAVDAHQQVEVEGRGHAGRVVVGAHELARVFLEVDADDQAPARRQRRAEHAQQTRGLHGHQIADGRAREEARLVPPCQLGRAAQPGRRNRPRSAGRRARESAPRDAAWRRQARFAIRLWARRRRDAAAARGEARSSGSSPSRTRPARRRRARRPPSRWRTPSGSRSRRGSDSTPAAA